MAKPTQNEIHSPDFQSGSIVGHRHAPVSLPEILPSIDSKVKRVAAFNCILIKSNITGDLNGYR
jgi:hypothetical protein